MVEPPPPPSPPARAPARELARPSFQHRLEYWALRAVIGALGALSWKRASDVGAVLGRAGYRPFGVRRGVVERQISACFPELSAERVREIALASYESLGRTTVETAMVGSVGREGLLKLFTRVDGWDLLEAARAEGRGVMVVTGHLGNWELGGSYVAARGIPIDVIARGAANPEFERWVTETREGLGMRVVHDSEAVRSTPRALRENRLVAMVSDQGALGLASTYVPFFGRPAKTPRGPAVFALRLGVPVLFAASLRRPDGTFHLTFERVPVTDTGDRDHDVDAIVATYTAMLEAWVRRAPEQYFWQHRRWRHQPADTPAHLREP